MTGRPKVDSSRHLVLIRTSFLTVLAGCQIVSMPPAQGSGAPASGSTAQPSKETGAGAPSSPSAPSETAEQIDNAHPAPAAAAGPSSGKVAADCTLDGKKLWGKIQIVDAFPGFD